MTYEEWKAEVIRLTVERINSSDSGVTTKESDITVDDKEAMEFFEKGHTPEHIVDTVWGEMNKTEGQ